MVMYDNDFQTRPIKLNKTFAIDCSQSPVFEIEFLL